MTLALLVSETHEHADPNGDKGNNEVFVWRETPSVEENVHEHDGYELAGLSEDHGGVRDVRERSEAEGRCSCDEEGTLEVSPEQDTSDHGHFERRWMGYRMNVSVWFTILEVGGSVMRSDGSRFCVGRFETDRARYGLPWLSS